MKKINQKQQNMKMNTLSEIKSNAQKLFAEKEMKLVNDFLLTRLEKVDNALYNEVIFFEAKRNMILRDKKEGLMTIEQFDVYRNIQLKALSSFIDSLDEPKQKETSKISLSKKQLLLVILLIQILILLGVGILIYLQK